MNWFLADVTITTKAALSYLFPEILLSQDILADIWIICIILICIWSLEMKGRKGCLQFENENHKHVFELPFSGNSLSQDILVWYLDNFDYPSLHLMSVNKRTIRIFPISLVSHNFFFNLITLLKTSFFLSSFFQFNSSVNQEKRTIFRLVVICLHFIIIFRFSSFFLDIFLRFE